MCLDGHQVVTAGSQRRDALDPSDMCSREDPAIALVGLLGPVWEEPGLPPRVDRLTRATGRLLEILDLVLLLRSPHVGTVADLGPLGRAVRGNGAATGLPRRTRALVPRRARSGDRAAPARARGRPLERPWRPSGRARAGWLVSVQTQDRAQEHEFQPIRVGFFGAIPARALGPEQASAVSGRCPQVLWLPPCLSSFLRTKSDPHRLRRWDRAPPMRAVGVAARLARTEPRR